jgi:hypothetical protein
VRSGTAMKTPKNASATDHSSSCLVFSTTGPYGGFSSGVSLPCASPTQQSTAASPHPGHWRLPKLHGAGLLLWRLPTVSHHCRYHAHEASCQRHGGRCNSGSLDYNTFSDREVLAPAEALQRFK